MKTKTFLTILCILSSVHLSLAQIGSKMNQGNLVGTWINNDLGYAMTLLILPGGTGEFDGESFTFVTKENQLTIKLEESETTYNYKLSENTLTLSEGDLPSPVTFTRNGATPSQPTTTITKTESATPGTDGGEITGTWSGNGEQIEFAANGQCKYLGQTFPYTTQAGNVTLSTVQGNVMFAYKVAGDQLTLSANGQNIIYTKGTSNAAQPATGQGKIAPELVGQWCWINVNSYNQGASSSSRCITLNADGTYIYNDESSRSVNTPDYYGGTNAQSSDQGTWYVSGDRIYYNSPTKGQGSFRLEKKNHPKNVNDPMIVLDGEAYVTTTSRPPWR